MTNEEALRELEEHLCDETGPVVSLAPIIAQLHKAVEELDAANLEHGQDVIAMVTMRQELAELRRENEVLKSATAYGARDAVKLEDEIADLKKQLAVALAGKEMEHDL